MLRPFLCAALLSLASVGHAQSAPQSAWKLLHDPATRLGYPQATQAETALIWKASRIAGFEQQDGPGPAILLLSKMTGPFLKAGADETALVYGNGRQAMALLILRAAKPVLHLLLSNDQHIEYLESYSVKDIDGDGLRELALRRSWQGDELLTLLHFAGVEKGGLPQVDADLMTYQSVCAPEQKLLPGQPAQTRYVVWVLPGRVPKLRADVWGAATCNSSTFKLLKQGVEPPAQRWLPLPAKLVLP